MSNIQKVIVRNFYIIKKIYFLKILIVDFKCIKSYYVCDCFIMKSQNRLLSKTLKKACNLYISIVKLIAYILILKIRIIRFFMCAVSLCIFSHIIERKEKKSFISRDVKRDWRKKKYIYASIKNDILINILITKKLYVFIDSFDIQWVHKWLKTILFVSITFML